MCHDCPWLALCILVAPTVIFSFFVYCKVGSGSLKKTCTLTNEWGEICLFLTVDSDAVCLLKEGLLWVRDSRIALNEPPPKTLCVDRDAVGLSGIETKMQTLIREVWPTCKLMQDPFHSCRNLVNRGCSQDTSLLRDRFCKQLSLVFYEPNEDEEATFLAHVMAGRLDLSRRNYYVERRVRAAPELTEQLVKLKNEFEHLEENGKRLYNSSFQGIFDRLLGQIALGALSTSFEGLKMAKQLRPLKYIMLEVRQCQTTCITGWNLEKPSKIFQRLRANGYCFNAFFKRDVILRCVFGNQFQGLVCGLVWFVCFA